MASTMRIDRSKSTPSKLRAPAQRVATAPKMRVDLTCWFEDCGKALPRIAVLNEDDPFDSTVCCRRYYETSL